MGKDGGDRAFNATFGLTVRDWFAGQALAGMVANQEHPPKEAAQVAYEFADAMLAAREASRG